MPDAEPKVDDDYDGAMVGLFTYQIHQRLWLRNITLMVETLAKIEHSDSTVQKYVNSMIVAGCVRAVDICHQETPMEFNE